MSDINEFKDSIKPEALLQNLIRFNTTNPPGNEAECIKYIDSLLRDAGIETVLLHGDDPNRLNLIAKIKGEGNEPPLLMYGHADVVTTNQQQWKYPPFEGVMAEGCVWGRGALDMKGALAMMICAMLKLKQACVVPRGDIILCIVSDEEDGGMQGARYIVEKNKEHFKDVRHAIGEIGGFTMNISGKKFYPIMVAEKQRCAIRATMKGQGGHGSLPARNGAVAKLGTMLCKLNKERLPVHITPPVKLMLEALSSNLPFPAGTMLGMLANPIMTNRILDLMGEKGRVFDPILHNTVNATIVRGGSKINVIPSEVVVEFDGRILPGYNPQDILSELEAVIGRGMNLELMLFDKGPDKVDMSIFSTMSQIIKEEEKDGIPIPFVVSGVTDARFFAQLGIQTYGFTPMLLTDDIDFSRLLHNADERIPINALGFGTEAIYKLIIRYKA